MSGNPTGPLTYSFMPPPFPGMGNGIVQRSTDNAFIPCDLQNMDYQLFLAWVAAGNPAPAGWTGPTNP